MSIVLRKHVPLALVTICGIIMLLQRYVVVFDESVLFGDLTFTIQQWGMTIFSFTLGIGLTSLLLHHTKNVQRKKGPWYLSVWLILICVVFIIVGVVYGIDHAYYDTLYAWLYTPIVYGMNYGKFFIIYGIFYYMLVKRRSQWEPLLFSIVFCLGLIKRVPIGPAIWSGFNDIGTWIEKVPYAGGIRGWMTLMAIGTVTASIRVLLGKEQRALGVE